MPPDDPEPGLTLTAPRAQWSFWDRVQAVREQELSTLWKAFVLQALNSFTLNAIPVLVPVATFAMYLLLGHTLTASAAFTSLSLFTARTCAVSCSPTGHTRMRASHSATVGRTSAVPSARL
jgi:hypothetical protein